MELFANAEIDRLLESDDVLVFGKGDEGVGVNVAGGTARHVVNDDLRARFGTEGLEVLLDAFLGGVVVVTRDAEDRDFRNLQDFFDHLHGFAGAVAAGTCNHRHAAVHIVQRELDDVEVLLVGDRRTLARGSHGKNAGNTGSDKVVNHLLHLLVVDGVAETLGIVVHQRGEQRGENTSKLRSFCNLHSGHNVVKRG